MALVLLYYDLMAIMKNLYINIINLIINFIENPYARAHTYAREDFFCAHIRQILSDEIKWEELNMKITKTFAYALACIQELAKKCGTYVQTAELAVSQNIPAPYCQKILYALAKSGILNSIKGQGFCLLLSPAEITTLRVLRALSEGGQMDSSGASQGALNFSDQINSRLNSALENITIAQMMLSAK